MEDDALDRCVLTTSAVTPLSRGSMGSLRGPRTSTLSDGLRDATPATRTGPGRTSTRPSEEFEGLTASTRTTPAQEGRGSWTSPPPTVARCAAVSGTQTAPRAVQLRPDVDMPSPKTPLWIGLEEDLEEMPVWRPSAQQRRRPRDEEEEEDDEHQSQPRELHSLEQRSRPPCRDAAMDGRPADAEAWVHDATAFFRSIDQRSLITQSRRSNR